MHRVFSQFNFLFALLICVIAVSKGARRLLCDCDATFSERDSFDISKFREPNSLAVSLDGFLPQTLFKLWTDFLKLSCAVIKLPTMPADALSADALSSPARVS
jgi:hypothetical protein